MACVFNLSLHWLEKLFYLNVHFVKKLFASTRACIFCRANSQQSAVKRLWLSEMFLYHCWHLRQPQSFNGQVSFGPKEERHLVTCYLLLSYVTRLQIENAHEPLARLWVPQKRLASAEATQRQHMMLVCYYTVHFVLLRHTQGERSSQRVQVMHVYHSNE